MRGKRYRPALGVHYGRFIPAHAGKAVARSLRECLLPVHPRACGESVYIVNVNGVVDGSSPRMRGKLVVLDVRDVVHRFIPAHAGKAYAGHEFVHALSVHPRACGESNLS